MNRRAPANRRTTGARVTRINTGLPSTSHGHIRVRGTAVALVGPVSRFVPRRDFASIDHTRVRRRAGEKHMKLLTLVRDFVRAEEG